MVQARAVVVASTLYQQTGIEFFLYLVVGLFFFKVSLNCCILISRAPWTEDMLLYEQAGDEFFSCINFRFIVIVDA